MTYMEAMEAEQARLDRMRKGLAILREWEAALRSGEYAQGTGWLNRDEKFCCVGVLCDLQVKAGTVKVESFLKASSSRTGKQKVMAYALKTDPGGVQGPDHLDETAVPYALARMLESLTEIRIDWYYLYQTNDVAKLSFTEIADHLKEAYIDPLAAQCE